MFEVEEGRQETIQTRKVVGSRTNAETGKPQHATGFYVTNNDDGVAGQLQLKLSFGGSCFNCASDTALTLSSSSHPAAPTVL